MPVIAAPRSGDELLQLGERGIVAFVMVKQRLELAVGAHQIDAGAVVDGVVAARLRHFGDIDAIGLLDGGKLGIGARQPDDRRAEQRDIR